MISPNKPKNLDISPCSGFILRGVRGGPWIDGWKEWGWSILIRVAVASSDSQSVSICTGADSKPGWGIEIRRI